MKILLVGNYPLDRQESMRRYTELLSALLRQNGQEVTVMTPAPLLGPWGGRFAFWCKWLGYVDKFLIFPRRLQRAARSYDLVHICDHSNAMYLRAVRRMPHVITCHDLLAVRSARGHFPENPVSATGRLLQHGIAAGLESAGCIVCVSEKTRDDVREVLAVPSERTRVIPLPLEPSFAPSPMERQQAVLRSLGVPAGSPVFLHVGADHWYKNRFAVLPIFNELRMHERYRDAMLVMAGPPWSRAFHEYIAAHGLLGPVTDAGQISDERLCALYSAAEALIFPSREEGFGWPILEAQACGCPVATMDKPPMSNVAGEGGILIDPADPVTAALKIARSLEERSALREAGFRNLRRFENRAVTEAYLAAYRSVCVPGAVEYA